MKLEISWNEDSVVKEVEETESDVYKAIGEILPSIEVPNTIYVRCIDGNYAYGDAQFGVGKRGTFVKNGVKKPSMYVVENYNNIDGLDNSTYEEAYLTCINPESNNYKFYHLKPTKYSIGATYGRIGSNRGEAFGVTDLQNPYPTYMYWIRYYEKLSKGYTDQSDIYLSKKATASSVKTKKDDTKKKDEKKIAVNAISAELYAKLKAFAKHIVETTFVNATVTEKQLKESKKIFRELGKRKTVNGFNKQLMKLLTISPRKARYVSELLAKSENDFAEIIDREETLIAAMEALVSGDEVAIAKMEESFESLGIEVYEATEKQRNEVLSKLSDSLKPKVKRVYRVINQTHKKRFDNYLKSNDITTVKQLWHGSRNENWFSILQNGLQLNPNAIITGKMFGQGIYFAPSSMKSWNYTSFRGTSWARGNSDTAFMGLYATAYGKPHDVTCSQSFTQRQLESMGKNCVHAHAGSQLLNDEIIYYSESAMVLNYIVEFAA